MFTIEIGLLEKFIDISAKDPFESCVLILHEVIQMFPEKTKLGGRKTFKAFFFLATKHQSHRQLWARPKCMEMS